jgi:hypothetical protein
MFRCSCLSTQNQSKMQKHIFEQIIQIYTSLDQKGHSWVLRVGARKATLPATLDLKWVNKPNIIQIYVERFREILFPSHNYSCSANTSTAAERTRPSAHNFFTLYMKNTFLNRFICLHIIIFAFCRILKLNNAILLPQTKKPSHLLCNDLVIYVCNNSAPFSLNKNVFCDNASCVFISRFIEKFKCKHDPIFSTFTKTIWF